LWHLEVGNALLSNAWRQSCRRVAAESTVAFLIGVAIAVDLETYLSAWEMTLNFSRKLRLTRYDRAYLEFARQKRLPLADFVAAPCAAAVIEPFDILNGTAA
jgi:hypothetical protein